VLEGCLCKDSHGFLPRLLFQCGSASSTILTPIAFSSPFSFSTAANHSLSCRLFFWFPSDSFLYDRDRGSGFLRLCFPKFFLPHDGLLRLFRWRRRPQREVIHPPRFLRLCTYLQGVFSQTGKAGGPSFAFLRLTPPTKKQPIESVLLTCFPPGVSGIVEPKLPISVTPTRASE